MKLFTAIIWICRLLVGVLFIISGFIKANDPVGFSYKLQEYFDVFGMPFFKPAALFLAMFICIFEIVCGVATLSGSKMKLTSWLLMLMIVFFTFLTFYSAWFNKVTDCGCFGDALKLTPWQSFTKDIVLFILILPIFIRRAEIKSMLGNKGDLLVLSIATLVSAWFTMHCYNHLPWKDFRPYAVGKSIPRGMEIPPDAVKDSVVMLFIYEKDGKRLELGMNELSKADSTYKFIDRIDKVVRQGYKPPIHDFSISKEGTDITEQVLNHEGYYFLLIAYNINKSNEEVQIKINEFAASCEKNKLPFIGMSASADSEIEAFRHKHQNAFEYYTTDETTLKTIIRSNPGLVLLKKGVVMAQWHYNDFPTFEEFRKEFP